MGTVHGRERAGRPHHPSLLRTGTERRGTYACSGAHNTKGEMFVGDVRKRVGGWAWQGAQDIQDDT